MTVETKQLSIPTRGHDDIRNITEEVAHAVRSSSISSGIVTVFVPHSTAGVTTIEFEPGAVSDLAQAIRRLIPEDPSYQHNRIDDNAHSHLRAALIGPSVTVPFANRELILGTWQQIVLLDFDTHARRRQLVLQLVGD
jgi:secondary thiamine-phosphate synthase enzyme